MHIAGLIYGPQMHHLDHLAPLCAQLQIPLIVTDEAIAALGRRFYPDLEILQWDPLEAPEKLVSQFDTIYCSVPRVLFDEVFFFAQAFQNKRIRTIWCPHGNSDKGRASRFMEALGNEEEILTYGPRIEQFLRDKGISAPMTRVGNYRLSYYQKHKEFYKTLLAPKRGNTILYAPTWQDQEKNSSFPSFWPHLLDPPPQFSLIVKLHPNLYQQFPAEIEKLKRASSNVEIIEDFPPIYPLLDKVDVYIGDMSSIGYDFLFFKRPMILLSHSELTKAGKYLPPEDYNSIFELCESLIGSAPTESTLYEESFSQAIFLKING